MRRATAEDRANAERRRNPEVRYNFLLARSVLRALLHHITGQDGWTLRPDSRGKLQCFTKTDAEGPYISLSHTRGIVACAVSQESPIGIDIERWRTHDYTAIAGYAFGLGERETVAREGASGFYRIWTLREAVAKASGDGLFARINGQNCVSFGYDENTSDKTWQFLYRLPESDCSFAIAIRRENTGPALSLRQIDIAALI